MNGLIFIELAKFARTTVGEDAWDEIVAASGCRRRVYVPVTDYPDEDLLALVSTVSDRTGQPIPELLQAFGEFIVPGLIKMFGSLIDPKWRTIDLIANTEETIHEALRGAETNTSPPELKCERQSDQEVSVIYTSPRKMCMFAKGIVRGVAKHYGEQIDIQEPTCMLNGDQQCELVIRTTPRVAGEPQNSN